MWFVKPFTAFRQASTRTILLLVAVIVLSTYLLSGFGDNENRQVRHTQVKQFASRKASATLGISPPTISCNLTAVDFTKITRISWNPRSYVYRNFLSDEECDYWVAKAQSLGLQRSKVAAADTDTKSEVRTSSGLFMSGSTDAVLSNIEQRIARWTRLPVEHGEAFYFLQYEIGQQYLPHNDYFDPSLPGMDRYLGSSGQRVATVVMYLGTPEEGGETTFPRINAAVTPRKGDAILFYSLHPDLTLNPNALHGSNKVVRGVKYAATKWIRVNPTYRGGVA